MRFLKITMLVVLVFPWMPMLSAQCERIGVGFEQSRVPKEFSSFLSGLVDDLQRKRSFKIQKLIMPRIKISEMRLRQLLQSMDNTYGAKWQLVPHRIWLLKSSKAELLTCAEDRVKISAHYGFDEAYSVWLQISGDKDLGRLYMSFVKDKDQSYKIASFFAQQWTYLDKDYIGWLKDAKSSFDQKDVITGALHLDIAQKLAYTGGYLQQDDEKEIKALHGGEDWLVKLISPLMPSEDPILFADSILHTKGIGLLIRVTTPPDTKGEVLKGRCESIGKSLFAKLDPKVVAIKCSFNTTQENPKTEGYHGSRYIFRETTAPKEAIKK
jgi:hypothetical protein